MPRASPHRQYAWCWGPGTRAGRSREVCGLRRGCRRGDRRRPPGKLAAGCEAGATQFLFLVFNRHFIKAFAERFASTAETDLRAGQALQLQRDVFEDVGQVGAAPQALEEAAALANAATMLDHRRQPAHHPVVKTGNRVRRRILQIAQVDPGFEHGKVGPEVRATQRQDFAEFHSSRHPTRDM